MKKDKKKSKIYTPEFKVAAVEKMWSENLSYGKAAVLVGVSEIAQNGKKQLMLWEKIYVEKGIEGFTNKKPQQSVQGSVEKARLMTELEKELFEENQQLKMENAYLKKLEALILEKKTLQKK